MGYPCRDDIRQTAEGAIAVFDVIRALTGTKNARVVWARLQARSPELCGRISLTSVQFHGQGARPTPCVDPSGAQAIVQVLMGQMCARAERALTGALRDVEQLEDPGLLAQYVTTVQQARALRPPDSTPS